MKWRTRQRSGLAGRDAAVGPEVVRWRRLAGPQASKVLRRRGPQASKSSASGMLGLHSTMRSRRPRTRRQGPDPAAATDSDMAFLQSHGCGWRPVSSRPLPLLSAQPSAVRHSTRCAQERRRLVQKRMETPSTPRAPLAEICAAARRRYERMMTYSHAQRWARRMIMAGSAVRCWRASAAPAHTER